MKVMHYFEPCTGNLLLDISTKEKEQAAYLYMFRYIIRNSFNYMHQIDWQKQVENLRIGIGRVEQEMKEMILVHGKEKIPSWLQEHRRKIKDARQAIANLEIIGPLFDAAAKGDAEAAVRLFTDDSILDNPLRCNRRFNDHLSKLRVCDPLRLRVPKPNKYSPSVLVDKTGQRIS